MTTLVQTSFTSSAHGRNVEDLNRWCGDVWGTHQVTPHLAQAVSVRVGCTAHRFGPLLVSQVTDCAMERERNLSHIASDHFDHYALHIQQAGRSWSIATDQTVTMHPGEIRIVDLAQPDRVETGGGTSTMLYILRDRIDAVIPDFHLRHGSLLPGDRSRHLASFITSIPSYVQAIPAQGLHSYIDAVLTYVLTALLAEAHAVDVDIRPHQVRLAVVAHIESHLGDPDLSPGSIARDMGLSRSALYRLFPTEGGIARFIRLRRLRRVRRAIQGAPDSRSIGQISSEAGFASATHFWRAFSREYGYPPGHLRTQLTTRRSISDPVSLVALLGDLYRAEAPGQRVSHTAAPHPLWLGQAPATAIAS